MVVDEQEEIYYGDNIFKEQFVLLCSVTNTCSVRTEASAPLRPRGALRSAPGAPTLRFGDKRRKFHSEVTQFTQFHGDIG